MAKKVGRPTKYNAEVMLPKLAELAERGAFIEHAAVELGVSKQRIYDWSDPESPTYAGDAFRDAIKALEDKRDVRVINNIIDIAEGANTDGNASAAIFIAKNVLGWRDRIETDNKHEHKGDVSFTWGTE